MFRLLGNILNDDRWEKWWLQILTHYAVGAFSGYLLMQAEYALVGFSLLFASLVYQCAGYVRHIEKDKHGDTVIRDIKDYIISACITISIIFVYRMFE